MDKLVKAIMECTGANRERAEQTLDEMITDVEFGDFPEDVLERYGIDTNFALALMYSQRSAETLERGSCN